MPAFRFRAQVALDLRRRQEEDARRLLGDARRAVLDAREQVERSVASLDEAFERARDYASRADNLVQTSWYRNWILLKQQQVAAGRHTLAGREAEELEASRRAMEARRKLKSLERLRERMWAVHIDAERRQEQKLLDELGGLRHVARLVVPGGR